MTSAGNLRVRNAVLLDGLGGPAVPSATVAVRDGTIVYAGPSAHALPGDEPVIDAGGRWLIPGLIDCHVHLCFDGEADFREEARATEQEAIARATRNAGRALRAGITVVRDLGGIGGASIAAAAAQRRGDIPGPRILTAGQVLTVPGGHAHFIGREISTAEEMAAAVADLHGLGAEVVKVIATGGVLTPGIDAQSASFDESVIRAAVVAAHERGMHVAAHAIGTEGINAALRAGVDSIEHGCYLDDESLAVLASGDAALVATLSAPHGVLAGGDAVPDYARAKALEVSESHHDSFRRAAVANARIAAGTDAGTPFNRHGDLATELRLMHEHGLPLDRVLVAATSAAAALLGLDDAGAVAPGLRGDLVLLDADPLESPEAYRAVAAVFQAGRLVAGSV